MQATCGLECVLVDDLGLAVGAERSVDLVASEARGIRPPMQKGLRPLGEGSNTVKLGSLSLGGEDQGEGGAGAWAV